MAAGVASFRSRVEASANPYSVTADGNAASGSDCFEVGLSTGAGTFTSYTIATPTLTATRDISNGGNPSSRGWLFRELAISSGITSGSTTFALATSGSAHRMAQAGWYMTGGTIGALDKTSTSKTGTGTAVTTNTTGTLTQAKEVAFLIVTFDGSPTITIPTGWTSVFGDDGAGHANYLSTTSTVQNLAAFFIETAATTALTPSCTLGASSNWTATTGTYTWTDGGATDAITPAAITSTSAMSGAVQKLAAVAPAAVTATSAMSGSVVKLAAVQPSGITSTSALSGAVVKLGVVKPVAITATSDFTGTITKLGTKPLTPAAITSTSTLSGAVQKLAAVSPTAITATSVFTGTVTKIGTQQIVPGSITATSNFSGVVTVLSSTTYPYYVVVGGVDHGFTHPYDALWFWHTSGGQGDTTVLLQMVILGSVRKTIVGHL